MRGEEGSTSTVEGVCLCWPLFVEVPSAHPRLAQAHPGPVQTCHWRLAGQLVLSNNGPCIKGQLVIPAPCTTRTQ